MLGFVAPRLVLLSIPKTGTTALEAALAPKAEIVLRSRPEIKHLTMSQYNLRIEPLLRNIPGSRFRVAAVVREPISWLGSWYRYRQRPQTLGQPNSTIGISFEGFIQDYLSDERPPYAALGRQSGFLSPAPGKRGPDILFQYERMDEVLRHFEEVLKTELRLNRVNVSPTADMTLSETTASRLREVLADDYALWESAARPAP
ncbi:gamma-glutamyl kinase [Paracoccus sp. MC1862]|uniref:gamma-glutamyl kinase n=1 Tax=Paracoccus sp. MC1862 TaxID=2760307 RepID=UPI001601C179|nr:gamma-glutamyl kinase [Paracoccus sp. MC1862]MBB1499191.1 gamma-glutamyl kinase [Paracoccus sp. MC1862]QQO45006.1 gamma-glutamyl kinase [Paracoccus sp. MC1862]